MEVAMSYMDIKEIIDLSIQYENDTAQYYRNILPLMSDGRRKALIESLIKQEESHSQKLKNFKQNIDSMGFIQFPPEIKFRYPQTEKEYSDMTYPELVDHALALEKRAYEFYKSTASASTQGSVKDLFDALSNFEYSHIALLEREITYTS
jgi:rubrerythrin